MGRTKYRTRNSFIGGKRKASKRRGNRDVPIRREDTVMDQNMESASAKKFNAFGIDVQHITEPRREFEDEGKSDFYFIVQKSVLESLFMKFLCLICKEPGLCLELLNEESYGFATKGKTSCRRCCSFTDNRFFCERVGGSGHTGSPFDINVRSVLAFRGIGSGFSTIRQWCGIMNMPHCLSQRGYTKNLEKIENASLKVFETIVSKSRHSIVKAYKEIGVVPDKDGILDISVSFDGTWQKRGYSSHNGVASVIDMLTGFPIDFEVLSNYCNKCKIAEGLPDDPEWKEKHKANCPKNFDGTSNAMEVECAERLWKRSVEKNKYRYTTMLSDGDSKAYDAVIALRPYGDDVLIFKEDCINHVAKRMGTALRTIVATAKAQKESISGKGKLTDMKIKKIQNYYGRAIKDYSSDTDVLQKRIMAILLHLSSTDQAPKHAHCPPGETSWCFWQRSVSKHLAPGSHTEHETLPVEIGKRLVPVFKRLSEPALLKRCVSSRTQNQNESFHSLIWNICPKTIFVGKRTIKTAVTLAACQFSMGASFKEVLCQMLNMTPGKYLQSYVHTDTVQRLKRAEKASKSIVKKRRRDLKFKKLAKSKEKASQEGETYAAGKFDY